MSIKTEIDRIKQSKADIISALKTKGVTVPSDASIDDLSALVQAIEVGSDPVLQSKTVTPSTSSQTVKPDTGYDGLSQVTVNAMTTATQATPSISVSSSGLITASATQTAGYVSAGTKSATKQLTTKGATTWTPKTSNQTISSGTYLTGTQTIKGDSNLVASNIKSGVSIFGVTGTLSGGITPSGTLDITTNGTYDVTNYASASVNVSGGGSSSGGLPTECVTLTLNITSDGADYRPMIYWASNEWGVNETFFVQANSNNYTGTFKVFKGAFIFIVAPKPYETEMYIIRSSSGIETIQSGGVMAAQVNETGPLSIGSASMLGGDDGGLGGM